MVGEMIERMHDFSLEEYSTYDYAEIPADVKDHLYMDHDKNRSYDDFSIIVIRRNGVIVFAEKDNMEPEDASFGRDLSWIVDAIEFAYKCGVEDGRS